MIIQTSHKRAGNKLLGVNEEIQEFKGSILISSTLLIKRGIQEHTLLNWWQ
jgi:hypothetical protein